MELEELVGHKIEKISFDELVITLVTDKGKYEIYPEGECCAHAYIYSFDEESARIIEGRIIHQFCTYGFHSDDGTSIEEDIYDRVVDIEFYSIQTHGGDLDIELRTEHNGYYGGYLRVREIK